ncbi:CoA transferase [Halostreptopolyspora alba]|uniref:CoA transferase n=1 Tax=Halostreptopolyspora alba TaxID=2487137 RepID=A0A3N0EG05_9ACTN|nr:hypothetical protein EFW17_05395 [Nocardiopsaceae bacterium YIM 96095]
MSLSSDQPPTAPATPSPLDGVLVLDHSTSVAGQYAGRLFAMNGAEVVLVEPPEGTPTRRRGARAEGDSFLFQHLNQGKRSLALAPTDDEGPWRELLARADVVVRDQRGDHPDHAAPDSVDCVVGDTPESGPYDDWSFSELVHQALGGAMNTTGLLDRPPIYGLGERASYATGTTAYISAVAALHERRRSGRGQRVDATVFESVAAMGQNLVSQYSYNGTHETRARYPGFLAMLQCADAWVVLFVIRNWPTACRVFGCEHLLDDPRYATSGARLEKWPEIVAMFQEAARPMLADDVVEACQNGRVSAEKVSSLADLVDSEQWRVREVMTRLPDGGTGQAALRSVFTIEGANTEVRAPSPPLRSSPDVDAGWGA